MSRELRYERPDLIVSITARCREGRRFLGPLALVGPLVLWWLGRALDLFGVQLFAVTTMMNHIHLVVRAPEANVSAFMRYFLSNLGRDLNHLHGRKGDGVFQRHSQVHVLDDEAAELRISYVLANPVAAYLCERAEDWDGATSARALLYGEPMVGRRLDRRAWVRAGRPADRSAFEREVELQHTPLPGWEALAVEQRHARVRDSLDAREAEARAKQVAPVATREQLDACHPDVIPTRMKMSERPTCHATCPEREREYRNALEAVARDHARASQRYRAGERDVRFPEGTYRPPFDGACRRLVARPPANGPRTPGGSMLRHPGAVAPGT